MNLNKFLDPHTSALPISFFIVMLFSVFGGYTHIGEPNLFVCIVEMIYCILYTVSLFFVKDRDILKKLYDYMIGLPVGIGCIIMFVVFMFGYSIPIFSGIGILLNWPIIYGMWILLVLSFVRLIGGLKND